MSNRKKTTMENVIFGSLMGVFFGGAVVFTGLGMKMASIDAWADLVVVGFVVMAVCLLAEMVLICIDIFRTS